jgi:C4-type Zn-finger protein
VASIVDVMARSRGIKDACDELRKVLDGDIKVTLVVTDPEGLSAFKPNEGVAVTAMEVDGVAGGHRGGRGMAGLCTASS